MRSTSLSAGLIGASFLELVYQVQCPRDAPYRRLGARYVYRGDRGAQKIYIDGRTGREKSYRSASRGKTSLDIVSKSN